MQPRHMLQLLVEIALCDSNLLLLPSAHTEPLVSVQPSRYHSHPIFAPKPSQKDNENQRNYQALFRCDKTRLEPFVGAIVGPYDLQLPTQVCTTLLAYSCLL